MMQKMTPDEATVELYKCIYENEHNTTLEDVQRYVEAGARIRDIETLYGPPLLFALEQMCKPSILKYLIEKGGIDWSYKKGYYLYHFEMDPPIYFISISYNTYMNQLIHMWHNCKGSFNADNQELMNIYRDNNISEDKYKDMLYKPIDEYLNHNTDDYQLYKTRHDTILQQCGETYAEQVCDLFGVTSEQLENGILELPEKSYDITLLPPEDKPYCWNYLIDKPVGHAFDQLMFR